MSTVVISAAPRCLVAPDVCFDARPNFTPSHTHLTPPPTPTPRINTTILEFCGRVALPRRPGTAAANLQTVMKGQLLTELARRAGRFMPCAHPQRHLHRRGGRCCDGTSELRLDGGLLVTVILDPYCQFFSRQPTKKKKKKKNLLGVKSVQYCSKILDIFHIFSTLDTRNSPVDDESQG